jgi:acetamidase/formamidase
MNRLGLLTVAFLLSSSAGALAADVAGTWEVGIREYGGRSYYIPMQDGRLVIEEQGGRTTARYNQLTFAGTAQKDGLHLACSDRGKACGELVVQVQGDRITGKGFLIATPALDIPVTLEGLRQIAKPAVPRTHDYNPQGGDFSSFYSASAKPVLRIFPGDTVRTRTLDSRGQDKDLKPLAPRGNPLTGPFYVEGAMPGDTLVVHLDRVRTNRDTAYQTNQIANTALEAGYLRELAKHEIGFTEWKIDAGAGIATVIDPTDKLKPYTVKLSPMLGCVGVAPPRGEVMQAGHLGVFGGNMDSPQVKEGATLYIPVFEPGALLFVGDGHAQQGDGELPGQGLETSLDVQFRVDLIRDQSLGQTRLENADYVMVMGVGATLDAGMRSATTGMSRWLADAHKLTPQEIAAVLGTAMQFEIAEVVDTEYNVVAKVSKDALARLGK